MGHDALDFAQERADEWTEERRVFAKDRDGTEDVLCELDGDPEPFLVLAEAFAQESAAGDAGYDLESY